ncbi:Protein of unknown function [Propionibacterium freudenreichii]|nr:Protein of unknown function [Propionibacterium freudenreichii]CEH01381.1 Protein of unknown function [Propionibacterium freudenreichii]CEH06880.1 Protein of unknown function [Propionibacterium freudenreichii]CEI22821.1 Protein of unknown function [Propionibacterium freudenreichii]
MSAPRALSLAGRSSYPRLIT